MLGVRGRDIRQPQLKSIENIVISQVPAAQVLKWIAGKETVTPLGCTAYR